MRYVFLVLFMTSCLYSEDIKKEDIVQKIFEPTVKIELPDSSSGTGVVIYCEPTEHGYRTFLLTAAHVADSCISIDEETSEISVLPAKAVVTQYDDTGYIISKCKVATEVIAKDSSLDLALMEITDSTVRFDEVFSIADPGYTVSMLDDIMIIGCTGGRPTNLTFGKIIELEAKTNDHQYGYSANHIRTSATISFGNSGGAVLNENYEIVGIISSMFTEHISYAISLDDIHRFIEHGGFRFLLDKTRVPKRVRVLK